MMLSSNMRYYCVFLLVTLMTFSVSVFAGGPGSDGGGGQTVLTRDHELRFLDLAIDEKLPVKEFSLNDLFNFYTQNGEWHDPIGSLIQSENFFSCANSHFEKQKNPILKIIPKLLKELLIIQTYLPLSSQGVEPFSIKFPDNLKWVNIVDPLHRESLYSPSLEFKYQRPVASYAAQSSTVSALKTMPRDVLVVTIPLYDHLNKIDQCALQVHEALRYLNHGGAIKGLNFLTKKLTTLEIENLTTQIIKNLQIDTNIIPASVFLIALSQHGLEDLKNRNTEELNKIEQDIIENYRMNTHSLETSSGLATSILLIKMFEISQNVVDNSQQMIIDIAESDHSLKAYSIIRDQIEKLSIPKIHIKSLFKFNHD